MNLAKIFNTRNLYIVVGAIFFFYVAARAALVGVTYDEAETIKVSTAYPFGEGVVRSLLTANNHIINTSGIKILYLLGFDSLFLFRLPNVISFFIYQYFCYRIISRSLSGYIGVLCFFLLSCNLFLLDFFGLARGYGMSIAFMMGALCLGLESLQSFSLGKSVKSLILGAFSVISIYSMIYFFWALFLALHLIPLLRRDMEGVKRLALRSLAVGGGLFLIVAPLIALLIWRGELYYGGRHGFYQDTILSLTKYSFYSPELMPIHYIASSVFVFIFVLVSVCSIFYKFEVLSPKVFVLFINLSIVVAIVLSHKILGFLYPIDRVALFFYPLAILSLFLCLDSLGKVFSIFVSSILISTFSLIFISNANFTKSVRWWFDSRTEEILTEINKSGRERGMPVNLGFTPELASSMNYYILRNDYKFIHSLAPAGHEIPPGVDYYVYLSKRRDREIEHQEHVFKIKENLARYDKNIFLSYPEDDIIVFSELKERYSNKAVSDDF